MQKWIYGLIAAGGILTGCATSKPLATVPRFNEAASASVIIWYYSDSTSYMLKPPKMEGSFRSLLSDAQVLAISKEQPGRDLAVVVLGARRSEASEAAVMKKWTTGLSQLGYRRTVFLRSEGETKVQGLPIVEMPPAVASTGG
jgi:hypothetical protein